MQHQKHQIVKYIIRYLLWVDSSQRTATGRSPFRWAPKYAQLHHAACTRSGYGIRNADAFGGTPSHDCSKDALDRRLSGGDDAIRRGSLDRHRSDPAHPDRACRRRRERPDPARHLRREQLAGARGKAPGPPRRRRGRGQSRAAGCRRVRIHHRPCDRLCARCGEDRRRCADAAARHGLCADRRGAGGAFPRGGGGDLAADHALQQSAGLSRVDRHRDAGPADRREEHCRGQGKRARSAPLHRSLQSLWRPLHADGGPRRRGARRPVPWRLGLGLGPHQCLPGGIGAAGRSVQRGPLRRGARNLSLVHAAAPPRCRA